MPLKLNTASGGSVTLDPANTASNFTVTIPASTATMVTTDATQTLTNKTLTTPNIDSAQFATVSGTAPIYPCRAWVNFNGTGTVAIRASGNVSSITDNGTGQYTVNLTTAMPDANGSVTGGGFYFSGFNSNGESVQCALSSTSAVSVRTGSTGATLDFAFVNIAVFR